MKLNQKGFGVVESLLIVIALALIVGVGFYVVNANKDDKDSTQTTQTTSNSKTEETTEPTEAVKQDPVAFVQNFYKEYLVTEPGGAQPLIDLAKKYGTQNFVDYVSKDVGGDPVLCGQQGKSQANVTVTKSGGDVIAKISYPSNQNPEVKFGVIDTNGKLSIDTAQCV